MAGNYQITGCNKSQNHKHSSIFKLNLENQNIWNGETNTGAYYYFFSWKVWVSVLNQHTAGLMPQLFLYLKSFLKNSYYHIYSLPKNIKLAVKYYTFVCTTISFRP